MGVSALRGGGREVKVPFGALKGETDCSRLTILAVARGQAPDTCISEMVLIFWCEP